jgi:RNA recognition motif-containing protein
LLLGPFFGEHFVCAWRVFDPSASFPQSLESSSERFQEKSVSKRIYVGNLSFQTTEHDLSMLFERIGRVESVNIITDRDTGRSKGFAFVEMSDADADKAIAQLNGTEVGGRTLTVNEARPREDRGGRGDGGRGRSSGRGGYGGNRY